MGPSERRRRQITKREDKIEGRLRLREGERETEVTNLPKSPAEMESVTECQRKLGKGGQKGQSETC